jgi:uncharacterized protein (DUF608 family)
MGAVVTFTPLSKGRYRIRIDGVLIEGSKGITKDPRKRRHSLLKALDAQRIQRVKEEQKAAERTRYLESLSRYMRR